MRTVVERRRRLDRLEVKIDPGAELHRGQLVLAIGDPLCVEREGHDDENALVGHVQNSLSLGGTAPSLLSNRASTKVES